MEPNPTAKARDTCDLTVTIRGDRYRLRPAPGPLGRGWRLGKLGGSAVHRVEAEPGGTTCDRGDQVWRSLGRGDAMGRLAAWDRAGD